MIKKYLFVIFLCPFFAIKAEEANLTEIPQENEISEETIPLKRKILLAASLIELSVNSFAFTIYNLRHAGATTNFIARAMAIISPDNPGGYYDNRFNALIDTIQFLPYPTAITHSLLNIWKQRDDLRLIGKKTLTHVKKLQQFVSSLIPKKSS